MLEKESETIRMFPQTRTLRETYLENYSNNIIADVPLSLNLEREQKQDR